MRALAVLTMALVACGRDAAQVRWDDDFEAAIDAARDHPDGAATALLALAERAPRPVDAGAARLEAVRALIAGEDPLAAAKLLLAIADASPRLADRARAYYELARIAEARGNLATAERLYRVLVRTYPDLMPGERALAHLLRMARAAGREAVDAHLAWTHALAPILAHTALADDLLFQACDEARRRAEESDRAEDWATAEKLYRRLVDEMPFSGQWNDALWDLSWIYHRQARYREEIEAIEAIARTRAEISLFGQDEHPYYWQGQLRIARLYLIELKAPRQAIEAYLRYAELFPFTIKKDDVRFFAMCAALQAGDRRQAEELRRLLQREHPDSKYLRRVEPAFADPHGEHCVPAEVEP